MKLTRMKNTEPFWIGAWIVVGVSLACALSMLIGMAWLALLEDDRHRAPRHEVPPSYVYVPFAP